MNKVSAQTLDAEGAGERVPGTPHPVAPVHRAATVTTHKEPGVDHVVEERYQQASRDTHTLRRRALQAWETRSWR